MKKNFFKKKLTSTLALALVATSISIPNYAFAATTTKIVEQDGSAAPSIIYVGGSKVDLNLNKTYKTNSYTWTVSNSKIATVASKTGVVTAKAPGVVTVKVTVRNAKTKKWLKAYTKKLTVNLRATSIDIGADDFELMTGATKDLNAVKTPAKSTDAVRYYSDNKDVATVNPTTGVVTAVNPGTATITVYSKATAKTATTSKYNKTDSVKVTVPVGITKVEQTKAAEVKATFNTDAKDIKASDFSIVNDATKQTIGIKEAKADGKTVTITTFMDMVDGKTYTVTYKEKQYQFTATNNVVSSLSFSTVTVPYATATAVKVSKVDANGIILGTYEFGKVTDSSLEFKIDVTQGYMNQEKLYLFKIGDTAKATAIYHTYKYDDKGNEIGAVKAEATITAVDQTPLTVKERKYTIADNQPNWDTLTSNNIKLPAKETSTLWFYAKNSDDTKAVAGDYTFESGNPDLLQVQTDYASGLLKAIIYAPDKQGSAYVLVKDKNGKVVDSLPINIVAAKSATSVGLDKSSVTVSNTNRVTDTQTIKLSIKDQWGDDLKLSDYNQKISFEGAASSASDVSKPYVTYDKAKSIVSVSAKDVAPGTYPIKVLYDGGSKVYRTFTVVVVASNGDTYAAASYSLVLNTDNVDIKFDGKDVNNKEVTAKVAINKGGRLFDYADLSNATVDIKKGGTPVTASAYVVSGDTITFKALEVNGYDVVKQEQGSYTIHVKFSYSYNDADDRKDITFTDKEDTKGFYIADNQSPVVATLKETSVDVTGAANTETAQQEAIIKAWEFSYEGSKLTLDKSAITKIDSHTLGNSVSFASCYIKVPVTVNSNVYYVPVKVNLGKTIELK